MPIHDLYARTTPWERSFPDEAYAEARFHAIEEEAEARGADLTDPQAFVMLMAAGQALQDLRGPGEEAARIQEHGALLYHAFHFWKHGRRLYLLPGATARWLVDEAAPAAEGAWTPRLPAPAGYVQLPWHLFWARASADDTPESVDGFFWTTSDHGVAVMLVMGMREDRPGFSVVPIQPLPLDEAPTWIDSVAREGGRDFESAMPGSELERLYEMRTAGEVLKLAGLVFHHVDRGAAARERAAGTEARAATGPRPSALPYARIDLD